MVASGLMALALGITAASLPVPYVVESPGPTFNTLANDNGKPVISVTGRETFPAKGNLDLTTVYVDGGPNGPVTVFEAFSAWLDKSKAIYPEELIYPTGITTEKSPTGERGRHDHIPGERHRLRTEGTRAFRLNKNCGSRTLRTIRPRPASSRPATCFPPSTAKPVTSLRVVQEELAAGNGKPATVVVTRDGAPVTETITPTENAAGKFILGVLLQSTSRSRSRCRFLWTRLADRARE